MSTNTATAPPAQHIPSARPKQLQIVQRGPLISANFRAATKALTVNGTRSILTMLGVIIGVAAVITAVTQAEGTSAQINQSFSSLGSNILTVMSGSPPNVGSGGFIIKIGGGGQATLSLSDATALSTLPGVVQAGPVSTQPEEVIYKNQNGNYPVYGVTQGYQTIHNLQLAEGSWFNDMNGSSAAPDAVIGSLIAQSIFQPLKVDPIGQTINIGGQLFHVVGVLASSSFTVDQNVYAPLKAVQARLNNTLNAEQIEVQVDDVNHMAQVQQEITTLLEQRHHVSGKKDDFWVESPNSLIQNKQASASSLGALLVGIAAISLTVGGIGIMNIMLVSVTERTREIGIRMAVGANRNDIRNQFLIEAMLLSATGGAVGVFFGIFTGYEITTTSGLPFILDPIAILIAVGVAGLIGVVFGLYPAIRASELDPIVALRTS
jgi:putative ABC transport system permease protein